MQSQVLSSLGWQTRRSDVPADLPHLIHSDSRSIRPGQWFLPIKGESFDGHQFIAEVCAKGASGFLYAAEARSSLPPELLDRGIMVADTTRALQDLARYWRKEQRDCRVIGITGSSGKTSVKELLYAVLSRVAPSLKTEGSLNNELGVPLTLCKLASEHRFAVIEMGARHIGDIAFLSAIAAQDAGVLLNVGTAHAGEFGGPDKILEAKMEIASAPINVYFRDDERIHHRMLSLPGKTRITFGMHPSADIRILEFAPMGQGGSHIELRIGEKNHSLELPYFHERYAINVAAVLAIAVSLGLAPDLCLPGLKDFHGVKGRFQIHRLGELVLIDDAYNANPQSMHAGLDTLCQAYPNRAKVLILGDMNELGDMAESAHRSVGSYCAKVVRPERLITVGRMARWIAENALSSGMPPQAIHSFEHVADLLPELGPLTAGAQLLYVKASNSLRLNRIIDTFLSR